MSTRRCALVAGAALTVLGAMPPHAQPVAPRAQAAAPLTQPAADTVVAALQVWLGDTLPALEAEIDCDVTVHGEPRFDEFAAEWLVAYSAAGTGCDDMAAALRQRGAPLDVTFYRRPNAKEVSSLIAKMTRSVEAGFGCRIFLKSEPRFDDATDVWSVTVTYLGSRGGDCNGADEELGRQGQELRIWFLRAPGR